MERLKDMKQSVDIRHLGINSNGYRDDSNVDYDLRTCRCGMQFKTNKYGIYTQCESCFEKNHNECEMKVFNELSPIFTNPRDCHVQKPDNHLRLGQIDKNLFIFDIDQEGCYDLMEVWKKKVENKGYKVLYEFEASDDIGNPVNEWVVKDDYSLSQSKD